MRLGHHLAIQSLGLVEPALNPRLLDTGRRVALDVVFCSPLLRAVAVMILVEVAIDRVHLTLTSAGLAATCSGLAS